MVKKTFGYVLAVIGIIGLASSIFPQIKTILFLPDIGETNLLIISIILVIVGLLLVFKAGGSSSRKGMEVPIYHGKNIIGYRRMK